MVIQASISSNNFDKTFKLNLEFNEKYFCIMKNGTVKIKYAMDRAQPQLYTQLCVYD